MLTLIYACGLRNSEMIKLRNADIDRGQKSILIKAGKGKKDRYVVLPERTAQLMLNYLEKYPVRYWLVESPDGGPYSARRVQAVYHKGIGTFRT